MRLEKLSVNISKLTGVKIKNLDGGFTWKTSVRFVLFTGNIEWKSKYVNIKILSMWYVDKRLSNWNFIAYIQCTAGRSNLWFFIHFYYSQIMRLSRSFYFPNTYSN